MPRIDPSQLLQTLDVLLAPNGGIKSAGEVPRIVQLMQKFSKKLVSKCIYIHILSASTPDLLELFLTQKGWDLLNAWFSDAYATQNYFLCGDLIKLFTVCPMTSARLKENVEINQAPKLIRQLSANENISADVRTAALKILQKWMSVIRSPLVNGNGAGVTKQKQAGKGKKRPLSNKYSDENFVSGQDSESENEAHLDFDDSKDYNPCEDLDGAGVRKKMKRENSTDVDDLLAGSTETSEEDDDDDDEDALTKFYKKREARRKKEEERKKEKELKVIAEKKSKSFSKTEMRDKLQSSDKNKIKEIAKKLKEESKDVPSIISHLGRIPKIQKADSEKRISNNGSSFSDMMGGLDTVKSKPKAAPIKNKNKDLLEAFNETSPIKPKSKPDKSSSNGDKHRSDKDRERSKNKDRERSKDKDRQRDKDRRRSKDKHREKDRDKDRERTKDKDRNRDNDSKRESKDSFSKSSDSSKSLSKSDKSDSNRPKPKLDLSEKRKSGDLSSPTEKKSPKIIKESNFLGDILGDIMKEPPKKKKRRPSDVKVTESNLKELSEIAKTSEGSPEMEASPEFEKINSPEEVNKEDVENSNDMEFSEPTSDLPREVRGILVYAKGNKAKRKITWKEERDLVSVEYFELDETERVNVYKEKSFEEMKKKEAMFEKSKFNTGFKEEEDKAWKLVPIVFEGDVIETVDRVYGCYGQNSTEKKVQENRELTVLKALQFGKNLKDPTEPDPGSSDKTGILAKEIPYDDMSDNKEESSYSYSAQGWPDSSQFSNSPEPAPAGAAIPSNISSLLSSISPGLLSSILPGSGSPPPAQAPDLSKPPPGVLTSEEADLLAAQKAAAAALGLAPPSRFDTNNDSSYRGRGGPRGHYNVDRGYNNRGGYNNQYRDRPYGGRDNGGHRGHYNNDRGYKRGGYHNQYNRDRQYGGREAV